MTPAEVLNEARAAGVALWVEGGALRYHGPREVLAAGLLDHLKAHKPGIMAALRRPPAPKVPDGHGTLRDTLMAKQMRAMNEGRPPPLARPDPRFPPLSRASEARRRKVLAMLARDGVRYAVLVEDPNSDPVIMAVAPRWWSGGTLSIMLLEAPRRSPSRRRSR